MCKYYSSIIGCSTEQVDLKMTEYHDWCVSLVNNLRELNLISIFLQLLLCVRNVKSANVVFNFDFSIKQLFILTFQRKLKTLLIF